MSIKITVSATDQNELDEIMKYLKPVILKRDLRVRRKPPCVSGKNRYIAYINSRNMIANRRGV